MFWDIFFELCKNNNEKPNNVAKKLSISSGVVTKWKQGSLPNTEALIKLSEYFNVPIDYLLGRNNNPNVANSINNNNTTVTGTQTNVINNRETVSEQYDEMSIELLKAFQSLPFRDRIDILNDVLNRADK